MASFDQPKRLWQRTGVILPVTVAMVLAAGTLWVWLPYHVEKTAGDEINAAGGGITHASDEPSLLQQWIGPKYFERISEIDLSYSSPDDEVLQYLKGLSSVEILRLDNTEITDGSLAYIADWTNLKELCLDNTSITDDGLTHLGRISSLQVLSLANTNISDAGLQELVGLTKLEYLCLYDTRVTAKGVERLKDKLPQTYIGYLD